MAQQIAQELQRLRNKVDSMEIMLAKYRIVGQDGAPMPWRHDLAELEDLQEYRDLLHDRAVELATLIGGAEFESSPILAVWRKYCQSRSQ